MRRAEFHFEFEFSMFDSKFKRNKVFGEVVGLDTRIMKLPADRTLDSFFTSVDGLETELAEGVSAEEIPGDLVFLVVDVHAESAFHVI